MNTKFVRKVAAETMLWQKAYERWRWENHWFKNFFQKTSFNISTRFSSRKKNSQLYLLHINDFILTFVSILSF